MSPGRTSGILLHPTCLPGPHGIGDLGAGARHFLDFLEGAGQGLWQVLPLGPTGYGDSPYQCFSAFAGNPLLISLPPLVEEGLLAASDLEKAPAFPETEVDFAAVAAFKRPLLERAEARFEGQASPSQREAFRSFEVEQAGWLEDYGLFTAIKDAQGGGPWPEWPEPLATRDPAELARARREHARAASGHRFAQYLFFRQWAELRGYARGRGVRIMGDLPIFVAHDGADVWANPGLFRLGPTGRPTVVAGVPPDYFSATGQLWGNPVYRWEAHVGTGFRWWTLRFRRALALFDSLRVDHFRGFVAGWEVPAEEKTAVRGSWVKVPGEALFAALEAELGQLPIVAENLGLITPEVEALRERLGFPGMAVLQFAFSTDDQAGDFLPYNYPRDRVVYTGTHDNDTSVGWWTSVAEGASTRTAEQAAKERAFCLRYLGTDGREIHWDLIRLALSSVAATAIVPLQDVLGLGSEARMNHPGRSEGNWRWRYRADALTDALRTRLRELAETYGRAARSAAEVAGGKVGGR